MYTINLERNENSREFRLNLVYVKKAIRVITRNSLLSAAEKKELSKTTQTLISQTGFKRFS
jgi:hypothetical protein